MLYSAKSKVLFLGDKQPYVCAVCKFVLRDLEDVKSVHAHDACTNCVSNFKYINYVKWEKGWRPNVEQARSV